MKDWFRHDSDAWMDPKMMDLRAKHGLEGYGFFWAIVELLRSNSEGKISKDENILSKYLCIKKANAKQMLSTCLANGLLKEAEDGRIFSESLNIRISRYNEVCEARRKSGALGGKAKVANAKLIELNRIELNGSDLKDPPLPPEGEVPQEIPDDIIADTKPARKPSVTFADVEHLIPTPWTSAAREALAGWIEYHSETLKKPYKDARFVGNLIKRFESRPGDFCRAVVFSTSNNYQGLIEDRSSNTSQRRHEDQIAAVHEGQQMLDFIQDAKRNHQQKKLELVK